MSFSSTLAAQDISHTFKSIHPSLLLECLLLAVIWDTLGILSNAANWLDFELRMLCCRGFIPYLIGRVVDFTLWLSFHKRRHCL